jgi:hypothetical protein
MCDGFVLQEEGFVSQEIQQCMCYEDGMPLRCAYDGTC